MGDDPSYPYAATVLFDTTLIYWGQTVIVFDTNNGSHYWTVTLKRAGDNATLNSFNTSALTVNTTYVIADNTFSISTVDATDKGMYIQCDKTGTPGLLRLLAPLLKVTTTETITT